MRKALLLGVLVCAGLATVACEDSSSAPPAGPAVTPPVVTSPDGGDPNPTPSTCPAPTGGAGTEHKGNVNTETWTAASGPHIIPYDTNIEGTLTIEACAEVLLAEGRTLSVIGKIVTQGTESKRVHIGPQDPTKPFARIRTVSGTGTLDLAYTTIDNGGDPQNIVPELTGMLDLQGADQTLPSQETIRVNHVTLAGSKSNGIVLRDGAGFSKDSTDLTITGAAIYPMNIWARASAGIPVGKYTGNTRDEILLPADHAYSDFLETMTLHDRGVPYHVGSVNSAGDLRVERLPGASDVTTLTIEPNVTMRFKKGGVLRVSAASGESPATAALIAVGTDAQKITFTSAEPAATAAPGDWLGIWFGLIPSPTTKLDYTAVEYAGGTSQSGSYSCPIVTLTNNDAAIRIFGEQQPFITHTRIAHSKTNGIDRGYLSGTKPTFLNTNTFEDVANCLETYPRSNDPCPSPPPCPKTN